MVDGKTIDQLRHDLDAVQVELKNLKAVVLEFTEKIKIIDGMDSGKFQAFVRSLNDNDQSKK